MLKTTVMKKTFFIILSFAAAISCSETLRPDSDNNVAISRQQETSTPNYHIGLETALESLDEFIATMDGTKSNSDRIRIADVLRFGRHPGTTVKSTESTDTSTILYVVNFEDDAGYAVLAADSRLPVDVYAVTEKGRVDRNDLYPDQDGEFNPLALIHASAAGHLHVTDSLGFGPNEDQFPKLHPFDTLLDIWDGEWVITQWGPWNTIINRPAMLMTQWEQGSPYKDKTGAKDAGCTVVAVAQMMAYNQYPTHLDGVKMPFDILRTMQHISTISAYADDVARLYADIFFDCGAISFGEMGTLLWPKDVVPYLEKLGYSNVKLHKNDSKCDMNKIHISVDKGYPAIVSALDANTLKGHTWIVDGHIKQARQGRKVGEKSGDFYGNINEIREYVHCNWGWSGKDDGYYYSGIFNTEKPVYKNPTTKSNEESNFKSFFRIITYELP